MAFFASLFRRKADQPIDRFLIGFRGSERAKSWSAQNLMELYRNWVAVCVDRIAQVAADVPTYLYYANGGAQVRAYRCLDVPPSRLPSVKSGFRRLGIKAGQVVEIEHHPMLEFLRGNDGQPGWRDIVALSLSYECLIGNSYWLREPEEGPLEALIPLQSECMSVLVDSRNRRAVGYVYRPSRGPEAGQEIRYSVRQIVAFKLLAPGTNVATVGKGPLERVVANASLYDKYDTFECDLMDNNARPDYLLSYKGIPGEAEKKAILKQVEKAFGGSNRGRPLVSGGDLDVKPIGFNPRELQYDKGRHWMMRVVLAEFGVPESIALLNDANRASATVALQQFRSLTVNPLLAGFLAQWNRQVTAQYDDGLMYWLDESAVYDPVERSQAVCAEMAAGIIGRDEARAELGYDKAGPAAMSGQGQED